MCTKCFLQLKESEPVNVSLADTILQQLMQLNSPMMKGMVYLSLPQLPMFATTSYVAELPCTKETAAISLRGGVYCFAIDSLVGV